MNDVVFELFAVWACQVLGHAEIYGWEAEVRFDILCWGILNQLTLWVAYFTFLERNTLHYFNTKSAQFLLMAGPVFADAVVGTFQFCTRWDNIGQLAKVA